MEVEIEEQAEIVEEKSNCDLLDLAQKMFIALYDRATSEEKKSAQEFVMNAVVEKGMVPVYEWAVQHSKFGKFQVTVTAEQIDSIKKKNDEKIEEFKVKEKEAEEKFGETEIRAARLAHANFLKSIADKSAAVTQYRLTEEKTVGVGPKLDLVFSVLQLALFWDDVPLIKSQVEKAHKLLDEGGDWERRNQLKVYESAYLMKLRQFSKAAELLQQSIATFTCTELMTYNTFIFYTVVLSLVSCDRPTLKSKIINAPEILQVIREMPAVGQLMTSLYECKYRDFFAALVEVSEMVGRDRYLSSHFSFYIREIRVKAYLQFLDPYSSVSLESMANAFGVSVEFLDGELSRFIGTGKISCKIDKIAGLVESQRPDSRNLTYQQIIKQGDSLLNRVQKLARVINV